MCWIYFIVRVYHLLARELSFSSRLRWAPLKLRSPFGVTILDVWVKLRWCKRKLLISKSNWMRFKIWLILIGQFLLRCPWTFHNLHDCSPTPLVPNNLLTCRASSNVVVTSFFNGSWMKFCRQRQPATVQRQEWLHKWPKRQPKAPWWQHGDLRSIIVVIIKRDHHSQPRLFSVDRDLHYHSFHILSIGAQNTSTKYKKEPHREMVVATNDMRFIVHGDHHSTQLIQPRLFSMDRDLHYHSFSYVSLGAKHCSTKWPKPPRRTVAMMTLLQ